MKLLDSINGSFELIGGFLLWANVYRIRKDKKVSGVSVAPFIFYSAWGVWNLVYYPALGQWFSFVCGINVVVANIAWLYNVWRLPRYETT